MNNAPSINTESTPPGWITEKELARHLGISSRHLVNLRRRGLPYIPTLLLTTVGRRSGTLRDVALGYYVYEGNAILVASLGGAAHHPVWYLNLLDHPLAWITVNRKQVPVETRTAVGEERARI